MNAETLIAKVAHLPPPAPSVARLLGLLSRPDADNEEMIQVVRRDGVMSAKLLGLCNSAAYGLSSSVGSIDQAVLMLGHAEIHRLVMSVGFGGALSPAMRGYAMADGELWQHSLLTASVAIEIAKRARCAAVEPSIAYTAGLVHDIGKIVITHALDAQMQAAVRELIDHSEHSLIEAERAVIGADHAKIGACLLTKWGLPEVLIEAVANHHQPCIAPTPQLSAIVHVADILALEAGPSPGLGSYAMRANEDAVEALGLGQSEIESLLFATSDALLKLDGTPATT